MNRPNAPATAAPRMPYPGLSLAGSPRAPAVPSPRRSVSPCTLPPSLVPARAATGAGGRHCACRPAEPPAVLDRRKAVLAEARPDACRTPCPARTAPPPCRPLPCAGPVRRSRRGPAAARSGGGPIAPPAAPCGTPVIDGHIKEVAVCVCSRAANAAPAPNDAGGRPGRRQS